MKSMFLNSTTTANDSKALGSTERRRKTIAVLVSTVLLGLITIGVLFREEPTMNITGTKLTTISSDGTRIGFTKIGTGPPLVIVDGMFCYRENGPATQMAALLARHFTVYTYDRRGRGESLNKAPYSIAREVEDLQAVVKEAGGSPFAIGISSGGGLALQAVAGGVNLSRLALYEPPYITDNGQPHSYKAARLRIEELLSEDDRPGAVRFALTDIIGAPKPFVFAMPFIMRTTWKRNESVAPTLAYDIAISDDWSVLKDRKNLIPIPVLVLGGEKSPQPLRDAVSTVAAALPHARSLYLKGQAHSVSAAAVAPVLAEFFKG
jgi:pimeloyl-ACP methyl ester carboxylesterase